ncbi:MAG: RDD family protein [Nitrospirae bacterium]|nr:RDD family protein [Nitrospirota bacterium]
MLREPLNLEKEKKTNLKLALAVASIIVLCFFSLYVIFFLTMFFSPFLLFSFFPFPTFSENVVGLDGNLLIFSETVDFKGATRDNPPQKKIVMRIYNGESISEPEEVKSFISVYATGSKVYFFDKGLYRTFDNEKWEEFKNPEIGNNPIGAVGVDGIYVFSTVINKPSLKLIKENEIKELPLPDINSDNPNISSSQLLYSANELHLFWANNNNLLWTRYNGRQWSKPEIFDKTEKTKAIVFQDKIILIGFKNVCQQTRITLRTFDSNSWSEPEEMNIQGSFFNIIPAVLNGRLIVFQQGFFTEKYSLIDRGKPEGPFKISRLSVPADFLWKGFLVLIIVNIILFLFVFLLSFVIRKYKLRTWRIDTVEFEFASLFRRFLAKFLDSLIILIPTCIPSYFAFRDDLFLENPFKLMELFFYSLGVIVLGGYLYHSLLEGIWGKTVGKKICGIVVLKEDFTKCTIGGGFLRNLLRIVDNFFYYYLIGVIAITGTLKWQRLGDLVAGTIVVIDKR